MTSKTVNTTHRSSVGVINPVAKWRDTFPEQFEAEADSQKFVSRCLMLGVAQVLKWRKLLPPADFKKRNVTDICQCWTFHNTFTGSRCTAKVVGAGEAIKLGYLKEFIIVVSTNEANHDDAIEVFTWSFAYNQGQTVVTLSKPDGAALTTLKYNGAETVKEETISMLLKIRRLCSRVLGDLPSNAFATFRVTYYETKPRGYQAAGFHRSETIYNLPVAERLGLGGIAIARHKFFVSVQSIFLQDPEEAAKLLDRANQTLYTLDDTRIEYGSAYDIGASILLSPILAGNPTTPTSNSDINLASPDDLKKHMSILAINQKSPGRCSLLDVTSPEIKQKKQAP